MCKPNSGNLSAKVVSQVTSSPKPKRTFKITGFCHIASACTKLVYATVVHVLLPHQGSTVIRKFNKEELLYFVLTN